MDLLTGSYDLRLDSKVRTSMPMPFRLAMKVQPTSEIMLTIGADGCIVLGDLETFGADYLSKIQRLDWTRGEDRALLRDMAPHTFRVRLDSQGRITIPQALQQWAGLKAGDAARAQGMGCYIELWEVRRLEGLPGRGKSYEDRLERLLGQRAPEGPSQG